MNREESLAVIGNDIVALIADQASQIGTGITNELDAVAQYAAARADHLALLLQNGEPGFDQALLAERDNVVLKAASGAVARADDLDARILAVAANGLRIAAVALAAV